MSQARRGFCRMNKRRGLGVVGAYGTAKKEILRHPYLSDQTQAPAQLALRSFAAALALRDTFAALTGREDIIAVKWPNDVLIRGAKIAGILLETHHEGGEHPALIIGFGVNLMTRPNAQKLETTALAPTSLKHEVGIQVSPEEFLATLAPAYARWETQLSTYGFAPIRTAWLAAAANIGKTITARMTTSSIMGTFKTVDDSGALILQAADGQHTITAAEISF